MVKTSQRRTCPYCQQPIVLGDCVIVGTNLSGPELAPAGSVGGPRRGARGDGEGTQSREGSPLPSGLPVLSWCGGYPVIARPPNEQPASGLYARLRRTVNGGNELTPLRQIARSADLPARACPSCQRPLPTDIDERDFLTVAVIGTSQAGKTHYLASVIREACRLQRLRPYGYTEFVPDEPTAERYDRMYHDPLFHMGTALPGTQVSDPTQFQPLNFRVTAEGYEPFGLVMYDVAGEILTRREERARLAPFVQHAAGAIFLVDPNWLPLLHGRLAESRRLGRNQADLLLACIHQMAPEDRGRVPYAITVSKSDLLTPILPRRPAFADDPPRALARWAANLQTVDAEVRSLLTASQAHDLLAASEQLGLVTFHAVSALGAPPDGERIVTLQPRRCLDPLLTVLSRLRPRLRPAV